MTIKDKENELIEDFELFDDWMDKYNYIIDLGRELGDLPDEFKNENNLIKGCTSQVWMISELKENKLYFTADSDALIPKGIAALLVKLFSGHTPKEIVAYKPDFIDKIGLQQHLSPNRANGLASMIDRVKNIAFSLIDK